MSDDHRDDPEEFLKGLKETVSDKTRQDKGQGGQLTSLSKTSPKPDLNNLLEVDLRDDERLRSVYLLMCHAGFWRSTGANDVLTFWSVAEKALEEDRQGTPGRLFYGLIKKKDWTKISNAQEERAMARVNSQRRNDIHSSASKIKAIARTAKVIDEEVTHQIYGPIGFHHGVMTQCFLPQKKSDDTRWQADHGKASLVIKAGELVDPEQPNRFVVRDVPFGTKARMIMPYIVGYAVQHKTPVIDMGKSLRDFLKGIGMSVGGAQGNEVTRQVENIAAASITLAYWEDHVVRQNNVPIAEVINFWFEKDENQHTLWTPLMQLGQQFYETLAEHRVPINMEHLVRLGGSARRQDLYVWFSYRLPKLSHPLNMPLSTLHTIFGQTIKSPRHFKQKLREDLTAIANVYDGFNVELHSDYLQLRPSKPPIPPNVRRLIPF